MKPASPSQHSRDIHARSPVFVRAGQASTAGIKAVNEDALGIRIPSEPALTMKGVAIAIADGVSEAQHGKEAADICVQNFLGDYYSTPDAWSVKTSAQRVYNALNRWLCAQGRAESIEQQSYVSTLSVIILKSHIGHIFHVGDSRIYRLRGGTLEQLTNDHITRLSRDREYLSRAMGLHTSLDIDYRQVTLEKGDSIFSCTDGVYRFLSRQNLESLLAQNGQHPEECCIAINTAAQANGSDDNLSCQLVHIDALGPESNDDTFRKLSELSFPPPLQPGAHIDGYRVVRELHASPRSLVYLVEDEVSGHQYALKAPSPSYEDDPAYIERFIMEEWIGSRIDSEHVVKVHTPTRPRKFLYYLSEYVEGATLADWIAKAGLHDINQTMNLVRQIGKGLRAIHRRETLHQDLKPDNVIITQTGMAKLIDFGSCRVAGVQEISTTLPQETALGTLDYSAPEVLLGNPPSESSDIFSFATLIYEMLTRQHPYNENAFSRCQNHADFKKLEYHPAWLHNPYIPSWMDAALRKSLQINPADRYAALSELIYDLEHPNPDLISARNRPWIERSPLMFWKTLAFAELLLIAAMLYLFVRN